MPAEPALVTGAAGFIGSQLVRRLRAEGHRVVGVDAFRGVTTRAAATARLAELAHDPGFELVELDLTGDGLQPLVDALKPGVIFHLAARPGARDTDAGILVRDNVEATASVVAAAERAGVGALVFSSSSSVYGEAGAQGPCREGDPVAPLSPYGAAKRAAERLIEASSTRSAIVRLFTVYGPGQRPDMAFERFIAASLDGHSAPQYQRSSAARDFTYVADAVEGLLLAWRRGTAPIYNVSGGELVTLAAARRLIEELAGAPVDTHAAEAPPQPSATRADLSLARAHLGYRPSVTLRAGLELQVAAALSARRAALVRR